MEKLIEAKGIHKYFPGVHALDNVSFDLYKGEILGLVGENGAGKSTLNKVISGVETFDEGEFWFDGKQVQFKNAAEAIAAGISVIHQEISLCESVSVAENIFIRRLPLKHKIVVDKKKLCAITKKMFDEIGIDIDPNIKVEHLSTAQKQLVEIVRAISHNSKLIIMDEPTSALSPNEIKLLYNVIRDLKAKGVSIIYISHKLEEIFEITDRVIVLRDGKHVATKKTEDLTREEIISLMVGRKISEMYNRTAVNFGDKVLEVKNLVSPKINDVSFYVRAGEIVGFSGLMGAGRTELAKAIFGFDFRCSGSVILNGKTIKPNSTEWAKVEGIGFISEDRKLEGIFPYLNVRNNLSIASISQLSKIGIINKKKEKDAVSWGIKNLHVKTTGEEQLIATLSGGNQQKVLLARWLINKNLKLLIVDEPTRGIDVGAKAEIYAILDRLAKEGLAIMMISSEMQEIINVCDRVYVMKDGKITCELQKGDLTQTKLLEYAIS
jgi:ABC-type sugar transport system ATPase subunit